MPLGTMAYPLTFVVMRRADPGLFVVGRSVPGSSRGLTNDADDAGYREATGRQLR
jgi:hypothetical protein